MAFCCNGRNDKLRFSDDTRGSESYDIIERSPIKAFFAESIFNENFVIE